MKRGMGGGAHRGPVGLSRQRRTIRFVQLLLVVIAASLLLFAGYSWGRASGYDDGRRSRALDQPPPPAGTQAIVLAILGLGALGGALVLQGRGGVRIPTPARLEELAGRAEATLSERTSDARAEKA